MLIALILVAAIALSVEAEYGVKNLKPRNIVKPVNPRYTAEEWRDILAAQVAIPEKKSGFVKATKPQPDFAGKVFINDKTDRITNGNSASRGQFPWQAALVIDSSSFCGGSLISYQYVLTAAHCAGSSYQVTLGSTLANYPETGALTYTTRSSVVHSYYDPSRIDNDIALLLLPEGVSFSNYISPVRLPPYSLGDLAGETVVASGWGKTSDWAGGISSTLQYVDLRIINNNECAYTYGDVITASKICVSTIGGYSTCNGDSGGPLVHQEYDGRYTLVGIVSFGSTGGCQQEHPVVFTRVSTYLNWIEYNTGIYIN
ncbi:hypothetical protein L9F63_003399 [Diploptera punctata]|uniref:Peptidase S1 domain-containing protein n=1 Tax=Diploptera punctata TaxID=6984 RepID=A0AAD7ZKW5_DIPPU|nr:hypothetical protein L9F63_003399 [Diploptera punctata]